MCRLDDRNTVHDYQLAIYEHPASDDVIVSSYQAVQAVDNTLHQEPKRRTECNAVLLALA